MRKLFFVLAALAVASFLLALLAPGAYNDIANGISWFLDWVKGLAK